jgi:hypothetical protein
MTTFRADDTADGRVEVSIGGVPVLSYVYRPDAPPLESPRPFFHPLTTLGGETVTQNRPSDHPWHAGLSWALPNVDAASGSHNFWGGPTYVRDRGYLQLPNNGSVEHRGFTAFAATDRGVEIEEQLQWMAADRRPVFTEKRRIAVTAADDRWTLGFATVMRNVSGETLSIGSPSTEGRADAGYGGLFWRGPAAMEGGDVLAEGTAGMGERGDWMAYSSAAATVVMRDGDGNPRHPVPWFVRTDDYAGLCAAPFFSEPLVVEAGEKVRFAYSVTIADGPSDRARAAGLAATPTATHDSKERQ